MGITDLVGLQFECDCGRLHTVSTGVVRVGRGALSALVRDMERVSPAGAQIALVYEESAFTKARTVERELVSSGYVVRLFLADKLDLNKEQYFSVIVGVGGERLCDVVKLTAMRYCKKAFLIPLTLSGVAACYGVYREKEGFILQKKCAPPDCIVLDYNLIDLKDNGLAAGFGEAVSRLFSMLDARIVNYIKGERVCLRGYEEVKTEAFSLVERLKAMDRRDRGIGQVIAESNTVMGLLDQHSDGEVYGGGEVAAALCAEMLALREGRRPLRLGEALFLYAKVLTDFYYDALFFENKTFLPPPNNNLRSELITEYFGIDEYRSYKHQSNFMDLRSVELMKYRLSRYSREIKGELEELKQLFSDAERIFYRLYDDDGFSVSGIREEGALCVALAPDVSDRFTCLDYFKATGLLDALLY